MTCRKIVLAKNIAETSITIDDVGYVIDSGKTKESSYDSINKLACLQPTWIAKSNALQVIEILLCITNL
jgi:ATP-dependent RNA helicase DHX36